MQYTDITAQNAKDKRLLSHRWWYLYQSSSAFQDSWNIAEVRAEIIYKTARRKGCYQMFFAHNMTFTYINSQELCLPTILDKMKSVKNSIMGLVNCRVPIPGWQATDSKELLEKREHLPSGGWLLVHYPCSSLWNRVQEHGDPSTNWISLSERLRVDMIKRYF